MEVQLTDFENAAFTAFTVLITRALLVFDLDLLLPLSRVDENMRRAHTMDAVNTSKFWFRSHIMPQVGEPGPEPEGECYEEMTMEEIMNGKGFHFPGLIPVCYAYLEHIQCDETSFERLNQYLSFVLQRATGQLLTPARWMRRFVRSHPDYKHDSVVSSSIAYDLMIACDEIGRGCRPCPELHGGVVMEKVTQEGLYETPLKGSANADARALIMQKLRERAADLDGPGSAPQCHFQHSNSHISSRCRMARFV
jgi:glutamate--cysteine ligase catalytic subunit